LSYYVEKLNLTCNQCKKRDECQILNDIEKTSMKLKELKASILKYFIKDKFDEEYFRLNNRLKCLLQEREKCLNKRAFLAVVKGYNLFENNKDFPISDCRLCKNFIEKRCRLKIEKKHLRGVCPYFVRDFDKFVEDEIYV